MMIFGIVFLGLILRLISLNQSFWLDEAAQAVISQKSLSAIDWAADFQPPLYYYFSHFLMQFGSSEWLLRLPSVLFGVLSVYISYLLFSHIFNKRVGLLSGLMLAISPFHIYFSQEYRMYALLSLLILLSWMALWKKSWVMYGVVVLLSIFTHYFAFLSILSQIVYIVVFERKFVQKIFITLSFSIAPFFLWLPNFMQQLKTAQNLVTIWPKWSQVSNVGFLKFPGVVLAKFTVGMTSPENRIFYAVVVIVLGAIFAISIGKLLYDLIKGFVSQRRKSSELYFTLTFFAVPLLLAWVGGLWISAASPWRIQFVLPAFYAIIAVGIDSLMKSKRNFRLVGLIMITIVVISNLFFSLQYLLNTDNHRENWKEAVTYTDSLANSKTIIVSELHGPWAPMEWYSQIYDRYIGASTTQLITEESIVNRLDPIIDTVDHVILYTYLFEISDPNRKVEQYLLENNFRISSEKDFRGVGIIRKYTRSNSYALLGRIEGEN